MVKKITGCKFNPFPNLLDLFGGHWAFPTHYEGYEAITTHSESLRGDENFKSGFESQKLFQISLGDHQLTH